MPNYCNFNMEVIGKRKDVDMLRKYALAEYHYDDEGNLISNKFRGEEIENHFFRVFDFETEEDDLDNYEDGEAIIDVTFLGHCAWSVNCCMGSDDSTYYNDFVKTHKDNRGITLQDACKKLHLKVEVISEETGCCFWEHFAYNENGEELVNECDELMIACPDFYETYEEYKKENPNLPISEKEFEDGEEIYFVTNCNCIAKDGTYCFNAING